MQSGHQQQLTIKTKSTFRSAKHEAYLSGICPRINAVKLDSLILITNQKEINSSANN